VAQTESPLFPDSRRRHRVHRGLVTERQEHIFTWIAVIVVLLYAAAWVGALAELRRIRHAAPFGESIDIHPATPTQKIAGRLLTADSRTTAYLTDAMLEFLHPLRGESGQVRFRPVLPGEEVVPGAPAGVAAVIEGAPGPDFVAPERSGIYRFAVEMNRARRAVDDISIITLVPRSEKRGGRIGPYYLGNWPHEEGGTPSSPRYAAPAGFIQVTRENQDFQVSQHFRLRDFLTKDQPNVWPKYLLLDPLLIDKLELTIVELKNMGVDVQHVSIMSGFRTPNYNQRGGNTAGRASTSRHMYGDAADFYVDNDRDGLMDDIDGDGKVTIKDAQMQARAAEIVERKYPALIGGIGVYSACCGHRGFTHVDVRGYRARW
jgi:hypothetical protein